MLPHWMRKDKKKKDKEKEEHQDGPSEQNLILRRKKVKEGQMKIAMRWKKVRWWIWYQMINEDLTQIRLTLTVVFERDSPGTPSSSDILTSWLVFVFVLFLLHDLHLEHILLSQCKSWSTPQMNRKWFNLLNKQCHWCWGSNSFKSVHFEADIFCNRC